MPFTVETKLKKVYYIQHFFSKAMSLTIFTHFLILLIPLMITFQESIMHNKKFSYFQPKISFNQNLKISALQGTKALWFSTLSNKGYTQQQSNFIAPSLRFINIDQNNDGYNDRIQLQFSYFNNDLTNPIKEFNIAMELNFQTDYIVKQRMKGLIYFSLFSQTGIQNANLYSNVYFHQKTTLQKNSRYRTIYDVSILELENQNMFEAIYKYNMRNETIQHEYVQYLTAGNFKGIHNIKIDIFINKMQRLEYTPNNFERFIYVLIQYLAYYIPVRYLLKSLLLVIFKYNFIYTKVQISEKNSMK